MIKKTENCLYCGEKMESITAKKKFCSDLHRVYWNREQKYEKLLTDCLGKNNIEKTKVISDIIGTGIAIIETTENGETKRINSFSEKGWEIQNKAELNKSIPPMPIKKPGENSLDYAARKNEWKLKYTKP